MLCRTHAAPADRAGGVDCFGRARAGGKVWMSQLAVGRTDGAAMTTRSGDEPRSWPVWRVERRDPTYPRQFAELDDPPAGLEGAGRLPDCTGAVAIVGSRAADGDAQAFAFELARALVHRGIWVISGGAHGVDAAAHRGALQGAADSTTPTQFPSMDRVEEAAGRPVRNDGPAATVAILGTSLVRPYPRDHRPLFDEIIRCGGVIAEQPMVVKGPRAFLHRNRLIAALSRAIVVVAAPWQSGALSTAAHGMRLGRTIFAVPGAPWQVQSQGCLRLLRRGAQICTGVADVLSVLASDPIEESQGALFPDLAATGAPRLPRSGAILVGRRQHVISLPPHRNVCPNPAASPPGSPVEARSSRCSRAAESGGAEPPAGRSAARDAALDEVAIDPRLRPLLAALDRRFRSVDELALRVAIAPASVRAGLIELELDGAAESRYGRYRRSQGRPF